MEILSIQSSLLKKVEYDKELQELYVTFKDNKKWKYYGVTQGEVNSMILADSPGSYFLLNIKPNKRAIKI